MKQNSSSVTANCRYLDLSRRTHIPASVLKEANIKSGCMLEFITQNGCIIARPVVGITVPDHSFAGKLIRRENN